MDQWRPRLQVYTNTRWLLDKMVLKDVLQISLLYKLVRMNCKVLVDIFIKKV